MRGFALLSAGVAAAVLCSTANADCAATCMDKTCDYWDYAYSCSTLEDHADCDCSGCTCSDANEDDWLTTLPDETTGIFGYIGSGYQNEVTGTFSVAAGGYRTHAFDSYASVAGGFKQDAFARFSSVIGGGRNTARGRFSVAAGYKADAMQDFSVAFGFVRETCATRSQNSMAFCANSIKFNDYELLDLWEARRLEAEATPEDLHAVIAAQRKVITEQNARLDVIEAQLLEKGLKL